MTWRRQVAKVLISILILCGGTEFLFRGWYLVKGSPYRADQMCEELKALTQSYSSVLGSEEELGRSDMFALHPYCGWMTRGSQERIAADLIYFQDPQADSTFDILILGSSVGIGLAHRGRERLLQVLAADARFEGKGFRVFPYAHSSFKQPQQMMLLSYLLTIGFEPDAVVSVEGLNETAFGVANHELGVHPLHPAAASTLPLYGVDARDMATIHGLAEIHRLREAMHRAANRGCRVSWSCVLGKLYGSRCTKLRAALDLSQQDYVEHLALHGPENHRGPDFQGNTDEVVAYAATAWHRAARAMQALCSDREILLLSVLQPNGLEVYSKGLDSSVVGSTNLPEFWSTGVHQGYPKMREAGARWAAEGGLFLDVSEDPAFRDADVWRDWAHLNREGNEHLAELVGSSILNALEARDE